jgi:hypothetical protein
MRVTGSDMSFRRLWWDCRLKAVQKDDGGAVRGKIIPRK